MAVDLASEENTPRRYGPDHKYPDRLAARVVEEGADIGIALDGDADRLIVVDEKGQKVDGDQLLQVFLNLIKNASEAAGKEGGVIRLRTFYDLSLRLRRKDGTGAALPLQVEIVDDGPGLPAEIAADVFEPFVAGRENGTGLGLALVSKIISDHEGWISVDSTPGKTVFRLSLPVAPRDVVAADEG